MRKITYLLFIIIFAMLPVRASEYLCRSINLEDGLSQSTVTAMVRDHRGFLWIGTRFGLNKYDFDGVHTYYHTPSDSKTLPNNTVRALYCDSHGRVWVACEKGVAYYNEATNDFTQVTINKKTINARSFGEESRGVFIGGAGTLYFYDFASDKFARLYTKGGSKVYYTHIMPWTPGIFILATRWDGMWYFDRASATISRMPGISESNISATCVDAQGRLWVSPYGQGVFVYDRSGHRTINLNSSNSQLPNNIVLDITRHDKRMWIATDGGGIAVYNPATGLFDEAGPSSSLYKLGSVGCLYTDSHDNIYAGTVREGANIIHPVAMRTIHGTNTDRFAAVTALHSEPDGTLFIGDDRGGIFRKGPASDAVEPFGNTSGLKVTDIEDFDATHYIVATFDRGCFLMDRRSGALSAAPASIQEFHRANADRAMVMRIRKLPNGDLALATDQLQIYNPASGSLTPVKFSGPYSKADGNMQPFYIDNGRMMCLSEHRVMDYNMSTGMLHTIFTIPSGTNAYCAAFDGISSLYIGTDNGIMAHKMSSHSTQLQAGIDKVRICALAIGEDRKLWAGSNAMVYMTDLEKGNTVAFTRSDGVAPNEYLANATEMRGNIMYMGGVNGLLRINCTGINSLLNTHPGVTLNIADIEIDGRSLYSSIKDGCLRVPTNHTSVIIRFIDNGQNSGRRQLFRFHVRGNGTERTIETFSRSLDLNFLSPGEDYDILTAYAQPDGTWSKPQHLVNLAVMAPWWKSGWAITTIVLLSMVSLVVWDVRRNRLRRKRVNAQMESYRRNTLENEVAFLVNTNYAIRTPLTLVYAPLKTLLERLNKGEHPDIIPELQNIYRNTKKMRDAIDMALELHNIAAAPAQQNVGTHDISRSIEDVLTLHEPEFALKHLKVSYLPSQEMFPAIYDRQRLAMVIDTLIRNAVQRSADHASIAIRAVLNEDKIRVSFTDSGENLDEETLHALFNKYFTDDNAKFGNSLGFAYAKNIIEMQGGRIGAENNVDEPGLTLWFEFPAADSSSAEAYTAQRRKDMASGKPKSLETVLLDVNLEELTAMVVEEDNDLCMFMAEQLGGHFKRVIHAFNGKDALILTRQHQPDIVISSLTLPIKSGIELCRDLKTSPETSHIPVILLTAIKENLAMESGYGVGADSYLSKPFDMNVLLTRCRNLLHTRSVIRRRYAGTNEKDSTRNLPNADETFLLKIDRIIADNIENPDFSVDLVVEQMHYSRSALYNKFKELTGNTLGAHITEFRVRRAKELIIQNELTINEISQVLGFSSQRYFSSFFKERTGFTPTAYRQEHMPKE